MNLNLFFLVVRFLVFLFIFSLSCELFFRVFAGEKINSPVKTLVYQKGNNFVNEEDFFRYSKSSKIRHATIYTYSDGRNIIEYDYVFSTNNAGLVQKNDLLGGDRVVLIIGDSFTEGQGSAPWFYKLESELTDNNVKVVNLGILGTGPMQWLNLAKSVISEYSLNVLGVVINIIPHDISRPLWKFDAQQLDCLSRSWCVYTYGFRGFDFESGFDVGMTRERLIDFTDNVEPTSRFGVSDFRNLLYQSALIRFLFKLYLRNDDNFEGNLVALNELSTLGQFHHINFVEQKDIRRSNVSDFLTGRILNEFLKNSQLKWSWCEIDSRLFRVLDQHPNEAGYGVLRKCTHKSVVGVVSLVDSVSD